MTILHALLAWMPYVISWAISRASLSGRDKNATLAFIANATVITIISFRFPVSGAFSTSSLELAALITISLTLACGICAIFWPRDV
jgi:hypothetical protein